MESKIHITKDIVEAKESLKDVSNLLEEVFSDNSQEVYDLESLFERSQASKDFNVFRVMQSSKLIGFALAYERIPNYYHIWILAIDKNSRGKGFASSLYEEIEDYARRKDYKGVTLNSFNRFSNNLRLVIKRGYKIYDLDTSKKYEGDPKIKFRLEF